jgi:hypothetical protein
MTDTTATPPPPGWHPDPWAHGGLRWWDGTAWTAHAAPAQWAVASAPWAVTTAGPALYVGNAQRWSGYAAKAMMAWAAVVIIQALSLPLVLASLFEEIRSIDVNDSDPSFGTGPTLAFIPLNLVSSVSTVAIIVLAIWTYHGTQAMAATGHRTTLSTGWAAAGWFVPIISFWYPYQAVRDLVPVDHPARRRVGWWWACWLSAGFAMFGPMVAAWFSLGAAMLVAIVPISLAVAVAALGRQIAAAAGEGFDELARMTADSAT